MQSLPASEETPAESPRAQESLRRTVVLIWGTVLVFGVITLLWSAHVDVPMRDPHGKMFARKLLGAVVLFAVLAVVDVAIRWWRTGHTRAALIAVVRRRLAPRRLALVLAGLVAYHLIYICYRNLKSWDAFQTPHDAWMLAFDKAVMFGHSPAVLLHDLFGQHAGAWLMRAWYGSFPNLVLVAFPAAVVLAPRIRDAFAGIAAFMWVWILGTATYYLIPSLGPFHIAPQDFAGLPHSSVQETQARYLEQRAYLIAHPHASDAYAQVAAFASLHVGVSAVILGLAWWHGLRRITLVLAIFLTGTALATIYLGWHFAVDVPAGLAIAALAWWLGPRTVGVARRPG